MARYWVPAFGVCLVTLASAQTLPPPERPKTWVDEMYPGYTPKPHAIGLHNCLDQYPADAKAAGLQGTTSVGYRITEDGSVKDIFVLKSSGSAKLDKAAVTCVKNWRYTPVWIGQEGKYVESAWRNDVKWVITTFAAAHPPMPPLPPGALPPGPPPPPVNAITTQSQTANGPAISSPASIGRPHTCIGVYPPDAFAEHAQGSVMIKFTIGVDGNVHDIQVAESSGYASLDDAAVACASNWRYKPAVKDSQPIAVPWKAEVKWFID